MLTHRSASSQDVCEQILLFGSVDINGMNQQDDPDHPVEWADTYLADEVEH